MRVAVLGSGSFAAGDFIDLLLHAGRDEVLGIGRSPEKPHAFLPYRERARKRFLYRQLDLNGDGEGVRDALDAFAPDYVVNFAAQGDETASWAHPSDFFQTNCVALARLVDHLKDRPYLQRFLQVSSSSVYGNPSCTITEETPIRPESPYGVSKGAADLLLFAYHKNFGFPAQTARPPNLYGPHQHPFRIIPKAIVLLKRGQMIELHGGGHAIRSFLYVRDFSRAIHTILERGRAGDVYNVSPDRSYRIRDIVAVICRLLGKEFSEVTREVEDRRGQSSAQDLDSTKIRRELGWDMRTSLDLGIADVLEWIDRDWAELEDQDLRYCHKR